jgi:glycosyltransferase involved in cell wall biosynthesis
MRITLISRSWPSDERSGVSLAAQNHAKLLIELGHEISIVGSFPGLDNIQLPLAGRTHVRGSGSGAIYAPVRINRAELESVLTKNRPDLVIIEGWQTALTDSSITTAHNLQIPILLISHGISIFPHIFSFRQLLRSWGWIPYRYLKLPRLIVKLNAITTLDIMAPSLRFYDRDLAIKKGVPVFELKNCPIHFTLIYIPRIERKPQILVVGYFSPIKNQMCAIELLKILPKNINLCFVGKRQGRYFEICRDEVKKLKLEGRISFLQDSECDLSREISESTLIFSPSITEALPMTLIEGMAGGTPFVASSVGAVNSLRGGIVSNSFVDHFEAVKTLFKDHGLWQKFSDEGRYQYEKEFTQTHIKKQLAIALDASIERA